MKKIILFILLLVSLALMLNGCNSNNNNEGEKMGNRHAVFKTSEGTFELEIYEKESPITAGNFIKLAESGFYDGTRFHRVIKNFMIQGGDPNSKNLSKVNLWGTGGPGYAIKDEFITGLSNTRGTIAMANSGPNTGGSQFFINVVNNTGLDWDKKPFESKHPVFGKVVSGMDVVDKIVNSPTDSRDRPKKDVVIESVTIK